MMLNPRRAPLWLCLAALMLPVPAGAAWVSGTAGDSAWAQARSADGSMEISFTCSRRTRFFGFQFGGYAGDGLERREDSEAPIRVVVTGTDGTSFDQFLPFTYYAAEGVWLSSQKTPPADLIGPWGRGRMLILLSAQTGAEIARFDLGGSGAARQDAHDACGL